MVWIALAVGVVVLLAASQASASSSSTRPPGGATATPSPGGWPTFPQYIRDKLERWRDAIEQNPTPMPLVAFLLMLWREGAGKEDLAWDNAGGFYELGLSCRTVSKTDGKGTAKSADVDPLHGPSAIYGAQWEYQHTLEQWARELPELGYVVPPDTKVDAWLTLMHAPYSVGWGEMRAVLRTMHKPAHGAHTDAIEAMRGALELSDADLPDPGPQTDEKVRIRLRRLLAFPHDARTIGPLPERIGGAPLRPLDVRPFPSNLSQLLATAKRLADEQKAARAAGSRSA